MSAFYVLRVVWPVWVLLINAHHALRGIICRNLRVCLASSTVETVAVLAVVQIATIRKRMVSAVRKIVRFARLSTHYFQTAASACLAIFSAKPKVSSTPLPKLPSSVLPALHTASPAYPPTTALSANQPSIFKMRSVYRVTAQSLYALRAKMLQFAQVAGMDISLMVAAIAILSSFQTDRAA